MSRRTTIEFVNTQRRCESYITFSSLNFTDITFASAWKIVKSNGSAKAERTMTGKKDHHLHEWLSLDHTNQNTVYYEHHYLAHKNQHSTSV